MRNFATILNTTTILLGTVAGFTQSNLQLHLPPGQQQYKSFSAVSPFQQTRTTYDKSRYTCHRMVSTTNQLCSYTSKRSRFQNNHITNAVAKSPSLKMLPGDLLDQSYSSTIIVGTSDILASGTNQNIFEAEVFGDLSHICLDFLTFFSPETIIFRLVVLCGRICSIVADISLDNSITLDEAIFQSIMIFIAFSNFAEKLIPLIRTRITRRASFRDKRIYQAIFKKTGMGYLDFLALLSEAFQWIELSEGAIVVEDADNLLFTYRGVVVEHKAHESVDGRSRETIETYHGLRSDGAGRSFDLIGNLTRATKLIDEKMYITSAYCQELSQDGHPNRTLVSPLTFLEAKTTRTLLLRLNMKHLTKIAEKDSKMRESIKTLLLVSLQNKLSKYVPERD